MRTPRLSDLTLIAVAMSYLIQLGAGVFALSMLGRVLIAAPPRSLAMLSGEYGYDSGAFWEVAPAITGACFLLAMIANWKSDRRHKVLGAFGLFVLSGIVTTVFVAPIFDSVAVQGFSDAVDPVLQQRAAEWYRLDWAARGIDVAACVTLLVALTRSGQRRTVAET